MAGAGYKTFLTGDVFTADDAQTYFMDQVVTTFATIAARTAAIPSPSEGQVSYSVADDAFYVYSGSAWIPYDIGWVAWTPTFTNYSQGTGAVTQCYYARIGKTIVAQGYASLGTGTSSPVGGQIQFTLPVDHASSNRSSVVGQLLMRDSSPGTSYIGNITLTGSAPAKGAFQSLNSAGTYLTASTQTNSTPFTWADSDYFSFTIMYQGV